MKRTLGDGGLVPTKPASTPKGKGKGGLETEIHPLLRGITSHIIPSRHNPLKRRARDQFDPLSLNPYLSQSSDLPARLRKYRPLQLTQPGIYIAEAEELRARAKAEELRKLEFEDKKARGHTPNLTLGEELFKCEAPPPVEWWDKPYLKDQNYTNIGNSERLILDSDEQPVTIYIQHPVLIPPLWEKHEPQVRALMLTKQERKRLRRNDRQLKLKDHQDRVRLGLEPPAPPKVKLSNLMSVLASEAIKDPTEVEQRVRLQVQERLEKHLQNNEARKPSKEKKEENLQKKHERQLQSGIFSSVYRVEQLSPQHLFKVDINAKQLGLMGMCIKNPSFCLIIVVGSEKANRFYHKLLTNRIKWNEYVPKNSDVDDKEKENKINWEHNECKMIWTGQVKDSNFKKWSVIHTSDEDEAFSVLQRFGIENFWREALVAGPHIPHCNF